AIAGINLNVTVEKQAEEALRKSREEQQETADTMQQLLDASIEGILSTTQSGIIATANPALEMMFGYAPGELAGQPLELLIPEARRVDHAKYHEDFWNAPRSRPMGPGLELFGQRKDGTTFPVEVGLTYVATKDGGRTLALVTDITERK